MDEQAVKILTDQMREAVDGMRQFQYVSFGVLSFLVTLVAYFTKTGWEDMKIKTREHSETINHHSTEIAVLKNNQGTSESIKQAADTISSAIRDKYTRRRIEA